MTVIEDYRRGPIWTRGWSSWSLDTRRRIVSWIWAATVNLFGVAVLSIITISVNSAESLNLVMGLSSAEEELTVNLPLELDEPLEIEELDTLEELETEEVTIEEIIAPGLIESIEAFDEPTTNAVEPQAATPLDVSELTTDQDRIAETNRRVAAAGGGLDGPIRVSLSFSGDDDIDLHVSLEGYEKRPKRSSRRSQQPTGFLGQFQFNRNGKIADHIFYRNRRTAYAALDVDANAQRVHEHPCENVVFSKVPKQGKYNVFIDHFRLRGAHERTPYVVVVKYGRITKVYEGTLAPYERMKQICEFKYRRT